MVYLKFSFKAVLNYFDYQVNQLFFFKHPEGIDGLLQYQVVVPEGRDIATVTCCDFLCGAVIL